MTNPPFLPTKLPPALQHGGLAVALLVAFAAFALAAYVGFNAVKVVEDEGVEPALRAINVLDDGRCPDGWQYELWHEGSLIEERCVRDPFIVTLVPNSRDCNYGKNTQAGANAPNGGVIACKDVPNWPKGRIPE
mgnify:CR=1 FL=1